MTMASAHISMDITEHGSRGRGRGQTDGDGDRDPLIKYYQATELILPQKPVLHKLLQRQPAIWASIQLASGILSFALGVVFAATSAIDKWILTLFRVPLVTGILLFSAGLLSNLLYKYPRLLNLCFVINIGCLLVATVGAALIGSDLAKYQSTVHFKIEILVLCVTVMDILVSALLVFWIYQEKRRHGL